MKKLRLPLILAALALLALGILGQSWLAPEGPGFIELAEAQGNNPPVADAGLDVTVAVGAAVVLDGTGTTDPKDRALQDFTWSVVSLPPGSLASLDDTGLIKPSFVADVAGDYAFQLVVTQGNRTSPPDQVIVSTVNSAPVANAGRDRRISLSDTVTLDGASSTDFDGDALTYSWSITSAPAGSASALSDATAVRPTLFIDVDGDYQLDLTVNDGTLASVADTVFLSTNASLPPVSDAGRSLSAAVGETVTLQPGNIGDTDGDDTALDWSLIGRPVGSGASLSSPNSLRPNLTIDLPGTYVVQIVADDGPQGGGDGVSTMAIDTDNIPPVADAGAAQGGGVGAVIALDAAASNDAEGDTLTYRWALISQPAASLATLDDPAAIRPSFTIDVAGTYIAQLVVYDGFEQSRPATVAVGNANGAPTADGGPDQAVATGATVQLDAVGSSDPDSDPLTYQWIMLDKPNGPGGVLSEPALQNPTFTATKAGDYLIGLSVSDGNFESAPDTVLVSTDNIAPVANAGTDQNFTGGAFQLDGGGSIDANSDPLTYSWAVIHQPAGSSAAFSDPAIVNPTINVDVVGDYVVQLIVADSTQTGKPDTMVLTVTNGAPVANAGPDRSVTAGNSIYPDGTGSSDPNSDPLTYAWTLTAKPVGSLATLENSTAAVPRFVADLTGTYTAELVVDDGVLSSALDSVTFLAQANQAPVLTAVGNQSIDLGLTLTINLQGSDANNDPLIFAGLSLPEGASLNAATGVFTFQPDANQVGDHAVTFLVTDGLLADSETITITVVGAPVGGRTALSGRLVDANDTVTPIVNASVTLKDLGQPPVVTDGNGNFTIPNAPAGVQILQVDSTGADPSPDLDNPRYSNFREEIELIAGVTNVIERPIYLPRIDSAGGGTVTLGEPTTIINVALGVTMVIPANTAKNEDNSNFSGVIYISEVPVAFAPVALPDWVQPGLLLTIQAIDTSGNIVAVSFASPVPITFSNTDNMPAGSEVDIYSLNAATGSFFITGTGKVSADGSQIEMLTGGIRDTTWHFASPPVPPGDEEPDPDNDDPNNCPCPDTGSVTHVAWGTLYETHTLPGYRSFGQSRTLSFRYASTSADPQPIIETSVTIPVRSAVPNTVSTRLSIAGVQQGDELHTSTVGLNENIDETIRLAVQFDANQFATGLYPYRLLQTNNFNTSSVSSTVNDTVMVNNEINSPIGAGWTISGLERLHPQQGTVLLTGGTGSIKRFSPVLSPDGGFSGPDTFGGGTSPGAGALYDLDGDGDLDIAIPNLFVDTVSVFLNDGTGKFPTRRDYQAGNVSGAINNSVAVAVGDFNNDGLGDLAVTNQLNSTVSIHMGTGAGFFAPRELLSVPGNPGSIGVADLNGDGNDDLAVSTFGGLFNSRVRVFDGNGTGGAAGFTQSAVLPVAGAPVSLKIDDVAGDGRLDIMVAAAQANPDQVTVLTNLGNSSYSRQDLASGNQFNEVTHWLLDTADLDNDGNKDIVVANDGSTVTVMLGNGSGFGAGTTYQIGYLPASIALGEFNGDGIPDLAVASRQNVAAVGSAPVGIMLGDGIGGFGPPTNFATVEPNHIRSLVIGDVDGDSLPDLVLGTNPMSVHFGMASATTAYASPAGDFSTLVKNADGTFTRTTKHGIRFEYDPAGLMTAIIDRNGNTNGYGYDPQGRLTTVTDPVGLVTTLAYGGDGKLDTVTDPALRVTTFAHNATGDLVSITDPDLSVRQFAYDARHLLVTQTSKRNFDTIYQYGFHGRNVRADRPDNSFALVSPSEVVGVINGASGLGTKSNPALFTRSNEVIASYTDGRGNTTSWGFDPFDSPTQSVDSLSRTTDTVRDENGLATSSVFAAGTPDARTHSATYDARGNVLTATDQDINATMTFTYDPVFSLTTSSTDANGNPPTLTAYDSSGNPIETTDAAGTRTTMVYGDPACPGLVTTTTAAVGLPEQAITSLTYDPVTCNLTSIVDPVGNETRFTFDSAGNTATVTNAFGTPEVRTTQAFYDAMNRVVLAIDADLDETSTIYDAAGNAESITDANLNVTSFEFDPLERVERMVDPLLAEETHIYDGNGNLVSVTDRKGQTVTFEYDEVNRLISKTLPGNLVYNYGYDIRNNLTSIVDPDSNLTQTYDAADRLKTASTVGSPNQPGVTLTYTYDKNENLLTMDDGAFGVTNYTPDLLNRPVSIGAPGQAAIVFDYDVLHRRVGVTRPNGVDTTEGYDAAGRLTSINHALGLTTVSSFDYGYNARSVRTSLTQVRSALSVTTSLAFAYDAIDQVTSATHPTPAVPDETFTYDPAKNRISRDGQAVDSTIGAGNRLAEDALYTYVYDANGNTETRTRKSTGAVTVYTWDSEDRLTRIDFPDLTYAAYRYDGFDRRIEKDDNGVVTRYVYDGANILFEYDGANALLARYTHAPGVDQPLAMERDGDSDELFAANERFYYLQDGGNSVTDLTDQFGAVVRAYVYDSFGGIAQEMGVLVNPYTYTGREFDGESGLYFYRARYYHPESGRFLSEDPIGFQGSGVNFYAYVGNNPINFTDPSGLKPPQLNVPRSLTSCEKGLIGPSFTSISFGSAAVNTSTVTFVIDIPRREDGIDPMGTASGTRTFIEIAKYNPTSASYFGLLAHEVMHVAQHLQDPTGFLDKYRLANGRGYNNNTFEIAAKNRANDVRARLATGFEGCCE